MRLTRPSSGTTSIAACLQQEGSLKPDEVYSLTAFLLYKNGVIPEDEVLAQTTLPQVKMPNRDGYAIPNWKPGMPRPFPNGH